MSLFLKIVVQSNVFDNRYSYRLITDEDMFAREMNAAFATSPIGSIAISATNAGRNAYIRSELKCDVHISIPEDTAENAFVISAKGDLHNYRHIFSLGAFSIADKAEAVLMSTQLLNDLEAELSAYYISDDLIHVHANAFEKLSMRGFSCISDYLREASSITGESDISALWLSANIFQELKLIAVKKSDRIFFKYSSAEYNLADSIIYRSVRNVFKGIEEFRTNG